MTTECEIYERVPPVARELLCKGLPGKVPPAQPSPARPQAASDGTRTPLM